MTPVFIVLGYALDYFLNVSSHGSAVGRGNPLGSSQVLVTCTCYFLLKQNIPVLNPPPTTSSVQSLSQASWSQRHSVRSAGTSHTHTHEWTQVRVWSQSYSAQKLSLGCTSSYHNGDNATHTHTSLNITHTFSIRSNRGRLVYVCFGARCHTTEEERGSKSFMEKGWVWSEHEAADKLQVKKCTAGTIFVCFIQFY